MPRRPGTADLPRAKRLYRKYRPAAINFFSAPLLNVYTIFFFKSSSLLVSFAFMAAHAPAARQRGRAPEGPRPVPEIRLAQPVLPLLAAAMVPVFTGSIAAGVPAFDGVGCLPLIAAGLDPRLHTEQFGRARRQILVRWVSWCSGS